MQYISFLKLAFMKAKSTQKIGHVSHNFHKEILVSANVVGPRYLRIL